MRYRGWVEAGCEEYRGINCEGGLQRLHALRVNTSEEWILSSTFGVRSRKIGDLIDMRESYFVIQLATVAAQDKWDR